MKIISNSVKDTQILGKRLSRVLRKGDALCLYGEFGSGKTVLTKGIAAGLGIKKKEVISPSFVLLREHKGKLRLYHFDFYRLENIKEILDIGFQEYLYGEGVSVVEWADRLGGYLPKDYLEIKLLVRGKSRRLIKLKAYGINSRDLLSRLR